MTVREPGRSLRGVICLYSGSGNTRLACQYIRANVGSVEFDLFDILDGGTPDFAGYQIAGFATFTDFLDPPFLMQTFLEHTGDQNGKIAFSVNTYGFINGRTLRTLDEWVTARGFKVVAGHSLHTPESYPPMIASGRGNEEAPSDKELQRFKEFVADLDGIIAGAALGRIPGGWRPGVGLPGRILPRYSRRESQKVMGAKYLDASVCDECGICEKLCPYGAIRLEPKPVFDESRCYGCWSCYNHCPRQAIYTKKYHGDGQYRKPAESLREKLGTTTPDV